jgi:NTE family protein
MSKTALVLSAGGMFGAYQAGAYQALAEYTAFDMVVGVSVGALNGFAIASGCRPAELLERWRDPIAGQTLKMRRNPGLRRGWFCPRALRNQAESLFREFSPRIPFALAVIEVFTLRTRLVRHPEVTAAHLAATCSIPVFLPMVKIGRRRYVDGGIFEKLPIWAAAEMGATRIIAIDSLPRFVAPKWLRAGISVVQAFAPSKRTPQGVDLTIITPSEPLGDAMAAVHWKRENIDRWIGLGRRDAETQLRLSESLVVN